MKNKLISLFGWYGVLAIVLAYTLSNFNLIETTNINYQILNITGALGIVTDSLNDKDYQPVVLNIIWMLVGLVGLFNIIF